MHSTDLLVVNSLVSCLHGGGSGWLCTVVSTYGSSPRPPGSMLFVDDAGHCSGSLSGGCIEEALIEQLNAGQISRACQLVKYGATAEESARLQLPCGGQVTVLVERITPRQPHWQLFETVQQRLGQGLSLTREVDLASGVNREIDQGLQARISVSEHNLVHYLGPARELVMVGRSLVAEYVARFALALNYRVILVDPRQEQLADWPVEGVHCFHGLPDDWLGQYRDHSHCAVLALTHDPRIDDLAMLAALETNAFYIGVMGSTRTSDNRRQRLSELGVDAQLLARMKAPVGLGIGSKTPPEIAIAILAEIIAVSQGGN